MTVHESRLDAFKSLAQAMTESSNAESGTLGYEWFAGAEGKSYRLVETYANAAAVEAHFAGPVVQQLVPRLMALCTVDAVEIYGDPGPKVTQIASGLGAAIFKYWIGIGR